MTKVDIGTAIEMREQGYTLQQIGDRFGVTRERVRQLLGHHGVTSMVKRHQLEALLGVSDHVLENLEKEGVIKPISVGNYFHLYRREDIGRIREIVTRHCKGCGRVIPRICRWCRPCLVAHKRTANRERQGQYRAKRANREKVLVA